MNVTPESADALRVMMADLLNTTRTRNAMTDAGTLSKDGLRRLSASLETLPRPEFLACLAVSLNNPRVRHVVAQHLKYQRGWPGHVGKIAKGLRALVLAVAGKAARG